MRPASDLSTDLDRVFSHLLSLYCHRALIIGVHIRRGDYSSDAGAAFRSIPVQWYIEWVMDMQQHPERILRPAREAQDRACRAAGQPQQQRQEVRSEGSSRPGDEVVMLLISDEPESVAAEFVAHNLSVVTSRQVMEQALGPFLTLTPLVSSWFFDWWLFGQLYVSATSHSTFSYTATMFNSLLTTAILEHSSESNTSVVNTAQSPPQPPFFFCPNSTTLSLTAFNPWHIAYYHLQFWRVDFSPNATTPHTPAQH